MKKTKHTLLTAVALTAAMNMASASNVNAVGLSGADAPAQGKQASGFEEFQAVYGPPPDYYNDPADDQDTVTTTTPVQSKYDPASDEIQDVYGPAPFYYDDPVTTTCIQTTYGPPVWMWDTETTTTVSRGTTTTTSIENIISDTTAPIPAPVYGPPPIFYENGDINGDQVIDSLDMVVFRKYLLNEDTPEWLKQEMDVNLDGEFNIGDLVTLQNFILGRSHELTLPQPAYGPPLDFEGASENVTTTSTRKTKPLTTPNKNKTTTTTATTSVFDEPIHTLDPSDMPIQLMYGPPEYFGLDPETFQPKEK